MCGKLLQITDDYQISHRQLLRSHLASLLIFLHLLAVDGPDLRQLSLVVRVGDGGVVRGHGAAGPLVPHPHHALRHQHVVQAHQLRVRRVLHLQVAVIHRSFLLDLTQHREQRVLHSVIVNVCVFRIL